MEYLIYGSLILITLICLWALISIPKNYLFKALLIPAMILIAVSTWYTYQAVLGFGTEFKPDKKVMYHAHVADKKNEKIYILLSAAGDGEPRLHIYPYSAELEEQLEGAEEKNQQGVVVVAEIKLQDAQGSRRFQTDEKWVFYELPPTEWMPKK